MTDTDNLKTTEKPSPDSSAYQLVDYGDEIRRLVDNMKSEHKQKLREIRTELDLLWEVLYSYMLMVTPLVIGLVLMFIAGSFFEREWKSCFTSINVGIIAATCLFDLPPFVHAIKDYWDAKDEREGSSILSNHVTETENQGVQTTSDGADTESPEDVGTTELVESESLDLNNLM
ncbi:hypothetical protein ScPMuIL_004341 [Solemya velum]